MGAKYGANVDWFLADHEPQHLIEMQAYHRLAPFGDAWLQTACIEAAIINKDSAGDPVNPFDLIPNEQNRPAADESDTASISALLRSQVGL